MSLPRRDAVATVLVAVASVLYVLWVVGATPPGLGAVRATGSVILALGFAASASAVVPGFEQLLHGSKLYLAVTSAIGLVAFAAGVQVLVSASGSALGLLVAAMVVLWVIATAHHVLLAGAAAQPPGSAGAPRQARPA